MSPPVAAAVARGEFVSDVADEMLRLRREIEALKESIGAGASRSRREPNPAARAKSKKKAKRTTRRS